MELIWQQDATPLRGDQSGEAVYDTFLLGDTLPRAWPWHVQRRTRDAAQFGLRAPDPEALVDRLQAWRRDQGGGIWRVRVDLVAVGEARCEVPPVATAVRLQLRPWQRAAAVVAPLRVVSGGRVRDPARPCVGAKRCHYAADLRERALAQASGADDALLLALDGSWSELVHAALVVGLRDGRWVTPAPSSAPVRSTTLQALAAQRSIVPQVLDADSLPEVAWAVALNAVAGAQPIAAIDGVALGEPPRGLIELAGRLVLP